MVWGSSRSLKQLLPHLSRQSAPAPSQSNARSAASIPEDTKAVLRTAVGECAVTIKASGCRAMDPATDSLVVKAQDNDHIFVAIFSSSGCAPGLPYLRMKLHQQLQAQIRLQAGAITAVSASFASIDASYRRLHPFHGDVFEGVSLTLVYIDALSQLVHLASCGDCQGAACSLQGSKAVLVSGKQELPEATSARFATTEMESFPFDERLDGLVLGSAGLWREVAPAKAFLRLQHLMTEVPSANACNPAAHLTNFALHAVTKRMQRLDDPRMRALSSVNALESLWLGSRANYETRERTVLRRRRGDVHGDLTAALICLWWPGKQRKLEAMCPGMRLYKTVSAPLMGPNRSSALSESRPTASARWALLRMHFLTFPRASRQQTVQRWHELVAAAREAAAVQRRRKLQAAAVGVWGREEVDIVAVAVQGMLQGDWARPVLASA